MKRAFLVSAAAMILLSLSLTAFGNVSMTETSKSKTIRVYNNFNLPLEPATLTRMTEYNLSLCIFRSLFELDDASLPTSKILKSWRYDDSKKAYHFVIGDVFWSDGKPLTSQDVKLSIVRLSIAAPQQFLNVMSLLSSKDPDQAIVITGPKSLLLMIDRPTPELSMRLTTAFIPVIREDQIDPKSRVVANHSASLGPYSVSRSESTQNQLVLIKNPFFVSPVQKGADRIEMRPDPTGGADVSEVLKNGAWPNVILDQAFLPEEKMVALKKAGAGIWTRPVDRVLYMFPSRAVVGNSQLTAITQWIGSQLANDKMALDAYAGVHPAFALQPPGFVLHKKVSYGHAPKPIFGKAHYTVAVITRTLPDDLIESYFKRKGMSFRFEYVAPEAISKVLDSTTYDFILSAFGAADPSPVTWLSLVLENSLPFIADYGHVYRGKFQVAKAEKDPEKQIKMLVDLVHDAGAEGLYVPFAHFSSVAVSAPGISLRAIRESDETVDLGKVEFE